MERPETELDSFRQQWRDEVSARANRKAHVPKDTSAQPSTSGPGRGPHKSLLEIPSHGAKHLEVNCTASDNGLGAMEHDTPLEDEAVGKEAWIKHEPQSALEHYEQAVEKESQGSLGDSVNLYRKAFRLDERVHEQYKTKHFPPSVLLSKPANQNPSNAAVTVPNPAHHSLYGPSTSQRDSGPLHSSVADLINEFSKLSIPPAPAETQLSPPPPCPIAFIAEELLTEIFLAAAITDVGSLSRIAQVCKRFAYLAVTEDRIWKRVALGREYGFAAMHYWYACDVLGKRLRLSTFSPGQSFFNDFTPSVYPTYRAQLRHRPRIRFGGVYISTVNYTRPGGASQSQYTWSSPVHVVTYFRYLRFFRDGTAISLLTTAEPGEVVQHMLKENMHDRHGSVLPSAVMKDALRGRWRLSGSGPGFPLTETECGEESKGPGEYLREPPNDPDGAVEQHEEEGDLHIETEGVVPKYLWKMQFSLGSSGRKDGPRNNRLTWKGFWSYNRLTDDWGRFELKNDKPFYWSRVRSFGPLGSRVSCVT